MKNYSRCFPDVSCKFGAPMGRSDVKPDGKVRLRLCVTKWTDGAYDQGGAYWGIGDGSKENERNIYCAYNIAGVRIYVRANSRRQAAEMALENCEEGSTCDGYTIVNDECVSVAIRKAQSQACAERIKWLDKAIKHKESKPIEDYEC